MLQTMIRQWMVKGAKFKAQEQAFSLRKKKLESLSNQGFSVLFEAFDLEFSNWKSLFDLYQVLNRHLFAHSKNDKLDATTSTFNEAGLIQSDHLMIVFENFIDAFNKDTTLRNLSSSEESYEQADAYLNQMRSVLMELIDLYSRQEDNKLKVLFSSFLHFAQRIVVECLDEARSIGSVKAGHVTEASLRYDKLEIVRQLVKDCETCFKALRDFTADSDEGSNDEEQDEEEEHVVKADFHIEDDRKSGADDESVASSEEEYQEPEPSFYDEDNDEDSDGGDIEDEWAESDVSDGEEQDHNMNLTTEVRIVARVADEDEGYYEIRRYYDENGGYYERRYYHEDDEDNHLPPRDHERNGYLNDDEKKRRMGLR